MTTFTTTRRGLNAPNGDDDVANGDDQLRTLVGRLDGDARYQKGTAAAMSSAFSGAPLPGDLYEQTDTGYLMHRTASNVWARVGEHEKARSTIYPQLPVTPIGPNETDTGIATLAFTPVRRRLRVGVDLTLIDLAGGGGPVNIKIQIPGVTFDGTSSNTVFWTVDVPAGGHTVGVSVAAEYTVPDVVNGRLAYLLADTGNSTYSLQTTGVGSMRVVQL